MKSLTLTLAFFLPLGAGLAFFFWPSSSSVVDVAMIATVASEATADSDRDSQRRTVLRPTDNIVQSPGPAVDLEEDQVAPSLPPAVLAVVVPQRRIAVRALEDGVITFVADGKEQALEADSVMIELDKTQAVAEIRRQQLAIAATEEEVARADVYLRQAQFTRDVKKRLAEGGAIAPNVYRKWQFEVAAATKILTEAQQRAAVERAQLNVLRQQIAAYTMRAPIRGRVAEVVRGPGEYVRKGEIIVWMESEEKRLKVVLERDQVSALPAAAITGLMVTSSGQARIFGRSPHLPPDDFSPAKTLYFEDSSGAQHLRSYATGQVLKGSIIWDTAGEGT